MNTYEVYLTESNLAIVEADYCYCSGTCVWFFVNGEKGQVTVGVFNLENIKGFMRTACREEK